TTRGAGAAGSASLRDASHAPVPTRPPTAINTANLASAGAFPPLAPFGNGAFGDGAAGGGASSSAPNLVSRLLSSVLPGKSWRAARNNSRSSAGASSAPWLQRTGWSTTFSLLGTLVAQ